MKSLEDDAVKAQAVIVRAQEMQQELTASGGKSKHTPKVFCFEFKLHV